MTLIGSVVEAASRGVRSLASAAPSLSMDEWAEMFAFGNIPFRLNTTLRSDRETINGDFVGLVEGAYRANSVVFGIEQKRLQLFAQAPFRWQRVVNGIPGGMFGNADLAVLERPEPGETTQDLLLRIQASADFGGDAFIVRKRDRVKVLRPDWVTMVLGSRTAGVTDPNEVDIELIGLIYREGGPYSSKEPTTFLRNEFAHYAPIKDPLARYRGMPWLVPVLREIMGDSAATLHKLKFFENGATANMVVTLDPTLDVKRAKEWIELFEQDHKGVLNAYKTIYMGGGASTEVVGANMRQMDFKATQGAGETRIALAGGIHPAIAGLSEGLQGASLNAGNFTAARRLTADIFLRSAWANLCGSLEVIVTVPANARLWYDETRIPFLKDDVKDAAAVINLNSSSIGNLTDRGYTPDSVVRAITAGDLTLLEHSGYLSVQLQPLQAGQTDPTVGDTGSNAAVPRGFIRAPWIPEPTAGVPLLTSGEFRCPNTRADGKPCNALLAKAAASGTTIDCWRCKTEVVAA